MRSLATARDTVLFTVPRLMPSVAASPSDVWREGCWRFVVYPGSARGRPVDIVFVFCLQSRRSAIRSAVLDADTDKVLGPPGSASLPLSRRLYGFS
jgi:hypothetical protein